MDNFEPFKFYSNHSKHFPLIDAINSDLEGFVDSGLLAHLFSCAAGNPYHICQRLPEVKENPSIKSFYNKRVIVNLQDVKLNLV